MRSKIQGTDDIYPLTVIRDRYQGTYSDGMYLAFNLEYYNIPESIDSDDMNCGLYWYTEHSDVEIPVGKGDTPGKAIQNLILKLNVKL